VSQILTNQAIARVILDQKKPVLLKQPEPVKLIRVFWPIAPENNLARKFWPQWFQQRSVKA
jgi:hypothetical protein